MLFNSGAITYLLSALFAYGFLARLSTSAAQFSTRGIRQAEESSQPPLGLPAGATSIRSKIVDTFSCKGKPYGYYADVDNGCQIFHVCLSATFLSGESKMYKWSFICPEQTIFDQEKFTCARNEDAIPCEMAPSFYNLNENFGKIPEKKA